MKIEVSTSLTQEVERENQKAMKTFGKIAFWIGILGCIAYIAVSVAFFEEGEEPMWLEVCLWVFAVVFAVGLLAFLTAKKIVQKAAGNYFLNKYVFEDDFVTVTSYRGEEKLAEVKNYYSDFTKIRKTENYFFLCMGMKGAYPIQRSLLTEEESAWLYATIKKKK